MSVANWFRTHRKQVAMHSCVIVGFLLLVIFVAEPLFDRLEAIRGEAQLHRLQLPADTGGMRSYIDELEIDDGVRVEIRGWAFIEDEDSVTQEVYVVLESADRTYVFDTIVLIRLDVTRHFVDLGLNLDLSGFSTKIPARKIADGEYTIGLYISKGDVDALQYTNKGITKSRGTIEVTG